MEEIRNEKLTVLVSTHGAEMNSIKDSKGREYLSPGDPKYWKRHSPTLFPIIGKVNNGEYRLHGKTYQMGQHGFLQDAEFELIAQGDQQVTYAYHENEETLKQYPFRFNLGITYKLEGNKIHVIWHVENTDDKPMYFQIGGHPAFLVPGWVEGKPLKARLRIDNGQPMSLKLSSKGLILPDHFEVKHQGNILPVDDHTFDIDTIILDHSQVHKVELLNLVGEPHVTVDFKMPVLALWSPPHKNAPFICIEPWYGVCDWNNYDGSFEDKYLSNRLLPGASFMSRYTITINGADA